MAGLNWPGLLAWSTKYHDGTAPTRFKQMSDEDREFLEKAFEEAYSRIEDPNKMVTECIEKLRAEDRTDETIATALEIIDRCCDDPDVARNIEKLDGFQPLLDLARATTGSLCIRTLEILALLLSNNTQIQEVGVRRGALPQFLDMTRKAAKGSDERTKAFRALVALVRQVVAFETEFLRNQGGIDLLVTAMDLGENWRMREKAAQFVRSLCGDGRLEASDAIPLAGAVALVLNSGADLEGQNLQYKETFAMAAHELAQRFPVDCPPALGVAASVRLAALEAAKNEDNAPEVAILKECVDALVAGGWKPS